MYEKRENQKVLYEVNGTRFGGCSCGAAQHEQVLGRPIGQGSWQYHRPTEGNSGRGGKYLPYGGYHIWKQIHNSAI